MHLIIAEKNIAANRIAHILAGKESVSQKKEGGVNVYQFSDTAAIGLRGHVVEVDFEPGYQNWRSETHPPRSLIDAHIIKNPTEPGIVKLLQRLAKKADLVTIATDYDTEGELIGKEAYELVRQVNENVAVNRAKFSAITKEEITAAFEHACDLDFDLAAAGEARQIIDLMWGASLTRFISLAARRGGNNILSVGRVQSPTLAMIVDREKEIEAFVSEPYWELSVETRSNNEPFTARHTEGKFIDFARAEAAKNATKAPLLVTDAKEGTRADKAPTPFDTTGFIVAAARLGLSAANAMRIAEDLYMHGYISYPRTDNTVYPPSLNLNEILDDLAKTEFAKDVSFVKSNRREKPTQGKKSTTDHPPIHPAEPATPAQLGENWKVYELIVRRFLATLSPDAQWTTMKLLFDASGEPYTATGSRLAIPGWRMVYPYSDAKDTILPIVAIGDKLPIDEINLDEKATQPPPRYSQSKLIQEMEKLGLGTKSTRHDVIQKLLSRKYVEGAPLRPTLVGRAVTDSLESHAPVITQAEMTRTLEGEMEQISLGEENRDAVIVNSRTMLHQAFDQLEANTEAIGKEIMDQTDEERIIGPCPVCGQDLRVRHLRGASQFIGCNGFPECTFNISLPPSTWGLAVRAKEVCEEHKLHHVLLISKGARPWEIGCPFCMHRATQRENLLMMPSVDEKMLERLYSYHIYTVYDLTKMSADTLSKRIEISSEIAKTFISEANEVMDLLRTRSEAKKFLKKLVPPKKKRSYTKVMNFLHERGVNSIADMSTAQLDLFTATGLSEDEAKVVKTEAYALTCKGRLKESGVAPVTLKKYQAAGFISPEELLSLPSPYISMKSGVNIETVHKNLTTIAESLGTPAPEKISKLKFDKGRDELLSIPGVDEAVIEKLYHINVYNNESLLTVDTSKISSAGLSKAAIAAMQSKVQSQVSHVKEKSPAPSERDIKKDFSTVTPHSLAGLEIAPIIRKKYEAAGFTSPEELLSLPSPYISMKSGVNIETVHKSLSLIAELLGKTTPEKISKLKFDKGRSELLSIPGVNDTVLEKLYLIDVYDKGSLLGAKIKKDSKTGLSQAILSDLQSKAQV
jgi:DNA topoisomerase-1